MAEIFALPGEVVDLIGAGEVIDSLAAVVRELVENSLDAGATRLVIDLYPQQWQIRVADNGTGMSLADLTQAASPHSTSKIHTLTDLTQVMSLGFRGEALHSLARLAELTIASCYSTEATGWQVRYTAQGEAAQIEPIAMAPGTIVTVKQLFGRWPARRQAIPALPQQLRAIQLTLYQMALCHPHVTWQVQQQDQPWLTLYGAQSAQQILPQILREVQPSDLREWRLELSGGETPPLLSAPDAIAPTGLPQRALYLLLGLPDRCHRRRPDWLKIAVNGRCVHLPELEQVVLQALRRTLPRDRFPVCFLHLQVEPAAVDWNRHPAKTEIYLQPFDFWRNQVVAAIDQILQLNSETLPDGLTNRRVSQLLKTSEAAGSYSGDDSVRENPMQKANPPLSLRAVAQLHHTYIVVEHPSGVWLVEQHIAHERVLYEQLCHRWQLAPLPAPILLKKIAPAQVEQLKRLGIELEPFGEALWAVRNAPEPLIQREDCAAALLELSLGGDLQMAQIAVACRTAIRNGTPLTLAEMQQLIDQWQRTRHPHTCPHGRPICLNLEESSLSRFFRRHWMIGKSHGI